MFDVTQEFGWHLAEAAVELWGEQADPAVSVSIDAWESYLEPA